MRACIVGAMVWLVLSGCTVSNVATQGFTTVPDKARLLVMPPDIKYYRVTASGMSEPHAEWTEEARAAFDGAFNSFVADSNISLSRVSTEELSDIAVEYDKLHSAVGSSILNYHYGLTKLPTKLNEDGKTYAFDWTLGDGVTNLLADGDGDYALFVFYRDYQAGGGRVGMAVFAAILGAAIYTGHQGGFASLVDLKTGDVVWFNNVPLAQGNMRSPEGAAKLVDQLFAELTTAE